MLILLVGAGASLWAATGVHDNVAARRHAELALLASQRIHAFEIELRRNLDAVPALAGLFEASQVVTREEFHEFADHVLRRFGAIHAVHWIPRVAAEDRMRAERRAREAGLVDFRLWERRGGEARAVRTRDAYFPVYFAAPVASNQELLGFDMGSEPIRRAALERARDEDRLVVSETLSLPGEAHEGPAFVATMPVFRGPRSPRSRAERRAELQGFAVGVFRIPELVRKSRPGLTAPMGLVIHDASGDEPRRLYPIDEPDSAGAVRRIGEASHLTVGGRTWLVEVLYPGPLAEEPGDDAFRLVLLAGLALTLLLASYVQVLLGRTELIRRMVYHRTAQLREANGRLADEVRERTRAEGALRASEASLAVLLEHLPGAIWTADPTLRVTSAAGARLADFCGDPEVIRGASVDALPAPEGGAEAVEEAHRVALEEGRTSSYEVHTDGRVWEVRIAPVDEGAERRVIGVALDVTERRRLEMARIEARLQESRRLESLGLLAGGVAHDFNNILVGILGNASLLLQEVPADAPWRSRLAQIETAAQRASELTRQMLAYSGRGRFVIETIRLADIVEEMSGLLDASLPKKVALRFDFAPETPPVDADPTQIRQLVMNLITNAADAIGDGGGHITIRTRALHADRDRLDRATLGGSLSAGPYALLEVADDGAGMDEDTRRRMFDPFFTTKEDGHGLGLAATLGIVRGHHGALEIRSRLGHGTTVCTLLPASQRSVTPRRAAPVEGGATRLRGTVLVVDDEELVRTLARSVLEGAGMDVVEAADGEEALARFRERAEDVDVVLLDMTMPKQGGAEVFAELRKVRPDVPVILMSGYSEQEVLAPFDEDGPAAFVQKPFRAEQLVATFREILH